MPGRHEPIVSFKTSFSNGSQDVLNDILVIIIAPYSRAAAMITTVVTHRSPCSQVILNLSHPLDSSNDVIAFNRALATPFQTSVVQYAPPTYIDLIPNSQLTNFTFTIRLEEIE